MLFYFSNTILDNVDISLLYITLNYVIYFLSVCFDCYLSNFKTSLFPGISLAVCKAGAAENGVPLYRHIAQLAGNNNQSELVI